MVDVTVGEMMSQVIFSQNVNLRAGPAGDLRSFSKIRELDIYVEHPEERTDQNQDRIYSYSAPDIRIEALISCTSDAFEIIKPYLTRDAQGRLPTNNWGITAVDNNGLAKTLSMNGYARDYHVSKKETSNRIVDMNLTIRVEDETFTVA